MLVSDNIRIEMYRTFKGTSFLSFFPPSKCTQTFNTKKIFISDNSSPNNMKMDKKLI